MIVLYKEHEEIIGYQATVCNSFKSFYCMVYAAQ